MIGHFHKHGLPLAGFVLRGIGKDGIENIYRQFIHFPQRGLGIFVSFGSVKMLQQVIPTLLFSFIEYFDVQRRRLSERNG